MSLLCPGFFSLWKGVHRAALIGLLALLVATFPVACGDKPQAERPEQPTQALGPTATPMPTPTPSRDFWNNDFWHHTDVAEMRVVLDEGLDLQSKDEFGNTHLHYAAEFNDDPQLISLLLDRGAVNDSPGELGRTPLHLAAEANVVPVVAILLDRGADVMARAQDTGYTPLHFAANNEHIGVLSLLLERGADPTAANGSGTTPLHIATQRPGREAAVSILLESGADPAARNRLRAACLLITADGDSEYLPGLCKATPVPRPSSANRRTAAGQTSVCSTDVGVAVRTEDAEALHDYVSDRQGPGPFDESLQDRWLCIPGGVVREIAPIYVLNRARKVNLSMETVFVPGSHSGHAIRVTTFNPEKTDRELRTTGILCLTDDVESLQIGEKITTFGRYQKSRAYLDQADDDSDIQDQFVRFCKWER